MKSILETFHSHRVDTNKPWQISVDWRQTSDTCVKTRLDPYRHNLIVKEAERTRCRISMIILRALNLRESPFSVLSPAFIRPSRCLFEKKSVVSIRLNDSQFLRDRRNLLVIRMHAEELERTRNVNERNVQHFMANCDFLEFTREVVNF